MNGVVYLLPGFSSINRVQECLTGDSPTNAGISKTQGLQVIGDGRCRKPDGSTICRVIELSALGISCPGMRGIKPNSLLADVEENRFAMSSLHHV